MQYNKPTWNCVWFNFHVDSFSALEMLKGQAETDPQVVAVKFNCARVQRFG